jgi:hypothetical protein
MNQMLQQLRTAVVDFLTENLVTISAVNTKWCNELYGVAFHQYADVTALVHCALKRPECFKVGMFIVC